MKETIELITRRHRLKPAGSRAFLGQVVIGIRNESGLTLKADEHNVVPDNSQPIRDIQLSLGVKAA